MKSDLDFINKTGDVLAKFLKTQKEINKAMSEDYEEQLKEKDLLIARQNRVIEVLLRKLRKLKGLDE